MRRCEINSESRSSPFQLNHLSLPFAHRNTIGPPEFYGVDFDGKMNISIHVFHWIPRRREQFVRIFLHWPRVKTRFQQDVRFDESACQAVVKHHRISVGSIDTKLSFVWGSRLKRSYWLPPGCGRMQQEKRIVVFLITYILSQLSHLTSKRKVMLTFKQHHVVINDARSRRWWS